MERLIVLSPDELKNGIPFVLKLWNTAGVPFQWVQKLKGETAQLWYDIYYRADWEQVRLHATRVFTQVLGETEAVRQIRDVRCVVISTRTPTVEQLVGERS